MGAANQTKRASAAATRAAGAAVKRTKRAGTRRAARRADDVPIAKARRFKAAKPTEDTPLPTPIATFEF
ncbi:MAG: hypothetical protein D6689_03405 [Deltaproteobacteria bacterium]|nr:MAG: hypothetical protein D6689_03405 [Deltaproteobacteria bacterium]